MDAGGTRLWGTNGLCISNNTEQHSCSTPQVVRDGNTQGAIILWKEFNPSLQKSILRVQRVDSKGNLLWTGQGIPVHSNYSNSQHAAMISNGSDAAIIVWDEQRNSTGDVDDIYAQYISGGNRLWGDNGKSICTSPLNQRCPNIISDGEGGAIISWLHHETGYGWGEGIYAQYVSADGQLKWGIAGKQICDAAGLRYPAFMTRSGLGGVILAWKDARSDNQCGIFMEWIGWDMRPVPVGVISEPGPNITLPLSFSVSQNYPNPFNSDTHIDYQVPRQMQVVIKIFNLVGQEISTLVNEHKKAGYYSVHWDGNDKFGNQVGSGVYFYEIKAGSSTLTRKMVVLR